MKFPFNQPAIFKKNISYFKEVLNSYQLSGDYRFCREATRLLEKKLKSKKILLTPSGTDSLEMAAILASIQPGDEVIMPSYTFSSTANAFVLRGARIAFVDIRPDTMNIDEKKIEKAINKKTKAIVPVHYAGVACEMGYIMKLAKKYKLFVIEDAAQALFAYYQDKPLGTIGDYGCYSFHETKNITSGEGGAISINNGSAERAEIIREKGTNRAKFFRGEVDKYSWVDMGSSFLLSELCAAFLYAQLEMSEKIIKKRIKIWDCYYRNLSGLNKFIDLPGIPPECRHNGHIFYIKTKDIKTRGRLIKYLRENSVHSVFHYVPLHSSRAGKKFGYFCGQDQYTTKESERLLRLPLYYDLSINNVEEISGILKNFFIRDKKF